MAKLMIRFASPDHAYGFPQGAMSAFIEAAIEEKLARLHELEKMRDLDICSEASP